MNKEQATQLLHRYRLGKCTDDEVKAIEAWYASLTENEQWEWAPEEKDSFQKRLKARIDAAIGQDAVIPPVKWNRRYVLTRLVTAACVFALVLSTAVYYIIHKDQNKIAALHSIKTRYENDVEPGSNGAILTLANGKKILLDSVANGMLAVQGSANVISKGGQLIYKGTSNETGEIQYNSIITPKSRQYSLVLSDGTRVWLNAASSIRFPAIFKGPVRMVEITGEAYFEVAQVYTPSSFENKNKGKPVKMPFIVKINTASGDAGQVEVTGTHFNINAYDEEALVKTTLVEGSVKVKKGDLEALLLPGNQSQLNRKGALSVIKNANIDATLAWKNGLFSFDKTDIQTVMKQLARWYDIDVVYMDGHIPDEYFWGDIPRSARLSSVLKAFEKSGVRFAIEGKKVTVLK